MRPKDEGKALEDVVARCVETAYKRKDVSDALERFVIMTHSLSARDINWTYAIICDATARIDYKFRSKIRRGLRWSFAKTPEARFPIPWIDLFNGRGFVREECLALDSEPAPNAFLFSALLLRVNDWVPQIRQAAIKRLNQSLSATQPEVIARALYDLTPNLTSWRRLDSAQETRLFALVSEPNVAEAVANIMLNATAGPAAKTLSQLSRISDLDPYLHHLAEKAIQPAVRARATRFLLEREA